MPEIRPDGPDPASAEWCRAREYADRLFAALDALEDLGGGGHVVRAMRPAAREALLASLEAAREALDGPLARLRARRDARPAKAEAPPLRYGVRRPGRAPGADRPSIIDG